MLPNNPNHQNPEKPKGLDDYLGTGSKPESLDAILTADAKDRRADSKRNPEERKALLVKLVGGGAVLAMVAGLVLFQPWTALQKDPAVVQIPVVNAESNQGEAPKGKEWYYNEDAWPVALAEFLKKPSAGDVSKLTEAERAELAKQINNTNLSGLANINLPSEKAGYTPDVAKAQDDVGLPNPKFSYWTRENFATHSTWVANLLLNPAFGGWSEAQYPGGASGFRADSIPVFTPEYLTKLQESPKDSPIFADWGSDGYGMEDKLLPRDVPAPRWVGTITAAKAKFVYNKATLGFVATVNYDVTFTAYTKDKKKVTKKGNLALKFVQPANEVNNDELRTLVSEAKFTLK